MGCNIRLVEFNDTEVYPITESAKGTNAYYCEYCPRGGYRPNYAACLRRIDDLSKGIALDSNEFQCATAIGLGEAACMAVRMRREEVAAGKAIYFINRIKLRQNQVENADVIGIKLGTPVSHGLNAPKRMFSPSGVITGTQGANLSPAASNNPYAAAINKRVAELTEDALAALLKKEASHSEHESVELKDKSPVTSVIDQTIDTTGMSLLEIARLRRQQPTV